MVKQRITFPSSRRVDLTTLGELRDIDPTVELLYFQDDKWALGSVAPAVSREARTLAHMLLSEELAHTWLADLSSIRIARAALQGFRQIEIYTTRNIYSGWLVLDFRIRDWLFQRSRHWDHTLLIAKACGDVERAENAQKRLDQLDQEGKDIYLSYTRERRVVTVPGLAGGNGGGEPASVSAHKTLIV